jgi:hypothetical protein
MEKKKAIDAIINLELAIGDGETSDASDTSISFGSWCAYAWEICRYNDNSTNTPKAMAAIKDWAEVYKEALTDPELCKEILKTEILNDGQEEVIGNPLRWLTSPLKTDWITPGYKGSCLGPLPELVKQAAVDTLALTIAQANVAVPWRQMDVNLLGLLDPDKVTQWCGNGKVSFEDWITRVLDYGYEHGSNIKEKGPDEGERHFLLMDPAYLAKVKENANQILSQTAVSHDKNDYINVLVVGQKVDGSRTIYSHLFPNMDLVEDEYPYLRLRNRTAYQEIMGALIDGADANHPQLENMREAYDHIMSFIPDTVKKQIFLTGFEEDEYKEIFDSSTELETLPTLGRALANKTGNLDWFGDSLGVSRQATEPHCSEKIHNNSAALGTTIKQLREEIINSQSSAASQAGREITQTPKV